MTRKIRPVNWGMIGCGDVAEVKSGPGFQKAEGSALLAVMRRDRAKAEDFARRHRVPRVHSHANELIDDPEVDAVYVATPPSSHCELALKVAKAGKPCLVEKPMAMNHRECLRMIEAFRSADVPLWVAYYRRALPRFLKVKELIAAGAIGKLTSVQIHVSDRLATGERATAWRFIPEIAGAGLFLDMGSHCFDLLDFIVAPVSQATGIAVNSGRTYAVEDVTATVFQLEGGVVGSSLFNFNARGAADSMTFTGTDGELKTCIFTDGDVVLTSASQQKVFPIRNPAHVHQPLIQTIVDELSGYGRCASTGESGARTASVMERCLSGYYSRSTSIM